MKILMCRPDYYGIEYEINPWMNIALKVDHKKAIHQWKTLHETIIECGANVELVEPAPGWPDMVFTANAGLSYRNKIILSRFKYPERQGELPYYQAWFKKNGFNIINPLTNSSKEYYFEGAGDALTAGNKLFVGYGFRTDYRFYEQANYFDHNKLIYCELINSYFYHLDTCFCPLTDTLAMWYPAAFTREAQSHITSNIELLTVTEEEAKRFACNAVVLDRHVILPSECPTISALLKQKGFIVHACEMNEYMKAGGACKCLTLRLD